MNRRVLKSKHYGMGSQKSGCFMRWSRQLSRWSEKKGFAGMLLGDWMKGEWILRITQLVTMRWKGLDGQ